MKYILVSHKIEIRQRKRSVGAKPGVSTSPREITIGNYCLQVCTLRMVAGIAERVINDHSNVICPSSHWERRSLKRKGGIRLSRRTQNQNRSMPTKNRSTIQAVTAGQSPPRVEFSLEQPAASAAQPRKRSLGLSSVWPGTWTALMGYGGIGDKATIADFPSLHFACSKLQAPSSKNILRISRNPSRISCHGSASASITCVTYRGQS